MDDKAKLEKLVRLTSDSFYDLSNVKKFVDLKSKSKNFIKNECDYWIAFIYCHNNLSEKSVDFFLNLIENDKISGNKFELALLLTLKQMTHLGRLEEAKNVFERKITLIDKEGFNIGLPLLNWYVETFNPSERELLGYKQYLDGYMKKLGLESDKNRLKDIIKQANLTNQTTSRKYGELMIATARQSNAEKIKSIARFIDDNPPLFYKKLATDWLSHLKNANKK